MNRPSNKPSGASPGGSRAGKKRNIGHKRDEKGRTVYKRPRPSARSASRQKNAGTGGFQIIERTAGGTPNSQQPTANTGVFRVLIAVHRPRFRGRSQRAAALEGWEVTALLNKQDPVGMCAKPPRPPDLLILSEDFGRQKDLAIFRAVQKYREQGMVIVGLVEDCQTAPEGFPDSVPADLCDVCLEPPYKTADLRALFTEVYEELRGVPAPPPLAKGAIEADEDEDG